MAALFFRDGLETIDVVVSARIGLVFVKVHIQIQVIGVVCPAMVLHVPGAQLDAWKLCFLCSST
jgi:hypothetical protein